MKQKQFIKKTLAKIAAVALLSSAVMGGFPSDSAVSADGVGWTYNNSTGILNITSSQGATNFIQSNQLSIKQNVWRVTFSSGVTTVPDYFLSDSPNLRQVIFADTITKIGVRSFYNCDKLTSVTIPEGVTSIGSNAFAGIDSQKIICLPSTLTSSGISTSAFTSASAAYNPVIFGCSSAVENYCLTKGYEYVPYSMDSPDIELCGCSNFSASSWSYQKWSDNKTADKISFSNNKLVMSTGTQASYVTAYFNRDYNIENQKQVEISAEVTSTNKSVLENIQLGYVKHQLNSSGQRSDNDTYYGKADLSDITCKNGVYTAVVKRTITTDASAEYHFQIRMGRNSVTYANTSVTVNSYKVALPSSVSSMLDHYASGATKFTAGGWQEKQWGDRGDVTAAITDNSIKLSGKTTGTPKYATVYSKENFDFFTANSYLKITMKANSNKASNFNKMYCGLYSEKNNNVLYDSYDLMNVESVSGTSATITGYICVPEDMLKNCSGADIGYQIRFGRNNNYIGNGDYVNITDIKTEILNEYVPFDSCNTLDKKVTFVKNNMGNYNEINIGEFADMSGITAFYPKQMGNYNVANKTDKANTVLYLSKLYMLRRNFVDITDSDPGKRFYHVYDSSDNIGYATGVGSQRFAGFGSAGMNEIKSASTQQSIGAFGSTHELSHTCTNSDFAQNFDHNSDDSEANFRTYVALEDSPLFKNTSLMIGGSVVFPDMSYNQDNNTLTKYNIDQNNAAYHSNAFATYYSEIKDNLYEGYIHDTTWVAYKFIYDALEKQQQGLGIRVFRGMLNGGSGTYNFDLSETNTALNYLMPFYKTINYSYKESSYNADIYNALASYPDDQNVKHAQKYMNCINALADSYNAQTESNLSTKSFLIALQQFNPGTIKAVRMALYSVNVDCANNGITAMNNGKRDLIMNFTGDIYKSGSIQSKPATIWTVDGTDENAIGLVTDFSLADQMSADVNFDGLINTDDSNLIHTYATSSCRFYYNPFSRNGINSQNRYIVTLK